MAQPGHKPFTATRAAPALLLGVLAVQWLPGLPPARLSLALLVPVALAFWRLPRWRLPLCACAGALWAMYVGAGAMDARLPRDLEGRDFVASGRIGDLPQAREDATRFAFEIDAATLDGAPVPLRGRAMLSWYERAPPLAPCQRWRLRLRLKRPRGLLNPGTADAERTALQRRIVATGYVREDAGNTMLAPGACVDGVRATASRAIAARLRDPHDAALLRAFAVGDTRGLDQQDWAVARATGVSHLIAISGFHVGIAAVFGFWLAGLPWLAWPALALRLPRLPAQAAGALLAATAYSALAGFGLPTVRTLLMVAVVTLARCSRRGGSGWNALALALAAILAFDPLAVLAAGFWLSFTGVALLMLCLQGRERGLRAFLHELTVGQLLMTVSLLPLTLWFFGQASLVGVLSNLVAVPFVSFAIVPCTLLGTLLLLALCPPLAAPVLWLAARLAHAQWWLLERMAGWPGAHWYLPELTPWALLLATLGALWLFLPRGVPLRALGLLLFLPLLWPATSRPARGAFEAWVLDVGQGLSVLLRTHDHVLLYDTGARYPSGYDLGEAAVLPALHALGMGGLDVLVVSHADNDHAGGAQAVAAAFPGARRYAGEPARMRLPMQPCLAGQAWSWDGVRFRMLNPPPGAGGRGNDRSCVLLVEGAGGRLLLTGDITAKREPSVAAALGTGPPPVLLVPHHGSKHSSSAAFIDAVGPPFAIVSAGWRSRFGHPRPEVMARYAAAGVPVLNTADSGAVGLAFPAGGPARVTGRWRLRDPRYWRERR